MIISSRAPSQRPVASSYVYQKKELISTWPLAVRLSFLGARGGRGTVAGADRFGAASPPAGSMSAPWPDPTVKASSFRYNSAKEKLAMMQRRLQDVNQMIKVKNPSLLINFRRSQNLCPRCCFKGIP